MLLLKHASNINTNPRSPHNESEYNMYSVFFTRPYSNKPQSAKCRTYARALDRLDEELSNGSVKCQMVYRDTDESLEREEQFLYED